MTQVRSAAVATAYAHCRAVAKREAKNFYWSFRVLPQHKSDAMCAVYAFMRRADDLSDDESLSLAARRDAMAGWTAEWRASREGSTDDPVFVALTDTQQRFGIPNELLEQLVAGTTMDLEEEPQGVREMAISLPDPSETPQRYQVYQDFQALYRYCYLVASVVGLVCIRIFGYSDPTAELLAEQTGVAFQLTNILRDVREDAERGRIYLPLEDLAEAGLTPQAFVQGAEGRNSPAMQVLLAKEIDRARTLYRSADALIPLLDADARPAMEVLVTIYRRLLERVAREPQAVLRERVSVPLSEKLGILGRGLVASGMNRFGA